MKGLNNCYGQDAGLKHDPKDLLFYQILKVICFPLDM